MDTYRGFKARARRRRNRILLAEAGLAVLIVALLFGISYTMVKMIHGEPVLEWPTQTVSEQGEPEQDTPQQKPGTPMCRWNGRSTLGWN